MEGVASVLVGVAWTGERHSRDPVRRPQQSSRQDRVWLTGMYGRWSTDSQRGQSQVTFLRMVRV